MNDYQHDGNYVQGQQPPQEQYYQQPPPEQQYPQQPPPQQYPQQGYQPPYQQPPAHQYHRPPPKKGKGPLIAIAAIAVVAVVVIAGLMLMMGGGGGNITGGWEAESIEVIVAGTSTGKISYPGYLTFNNDTYDSALYLISPSSGSYSTSGNKVTFGSSNVWEYSVSGNTLTLSKKEEALGVTTETKIVLSRVAETYYDAGVDASPSPPPATKSIVIELKETDAPNTCANFEKYVQDGFYNGLIFHRVIDGFMIQGGGFYPGMTEKTATYPPINLEISALRHIDGAVAMARTIDPNSATCQFYICDGPQTYLDDQYAVFGQVTSGMEHVRAISAVATGTVGSYSDVPLSDVTIISASLSTSGGKTYVTLIVDY